MVVVKATAITDFFNILGFTGRWLDKFNFVMQSICQIKLASMKTTLSGPPETFAGKFRDAVRFWELGRIVYNLMLTAVVLVWLTLTWPHFRPALQWQSLRLMLVLAMLANVCYCIAYLVDLLLQFSDFRETWRKHRTWVWLAGTLFGVLLACYWIADEIYPFVGPAAVTGN